MRCLRAVEPGGAARRRARPHAGRLPPGNTGQRVRRPGADPLSPSPPPLYDALLLTGGAGRRLGGLPKPSLLVGGTTLASRAAGAVTAAARLIVVGPDPGLTRATIQTTEDPPGSGPVAAIAAGMRHVTAAHTFVLAGDLPFLTPAAVAQLLGALAADPSRAAVLPIDGDGRDQHLCAAWRTAALRTALQALGDPTDLAVHRLVAAAPGPVLRIAPTTPAGVPPPWFDCDTPGDLAEANRLDLDGD